MNNKTLSELKEQRIITAKVLLYAIYKHLPNQTFKINFLVQDYDFIQSKYAQTANLLYKNWLTNYRKTETYKNWLKNHLRAKGYYFKEDNTMWYLTNNKELNPVTYGTPLTTETTLTDCTFDEYFKNYNPPLWGIFDYLSRIEKLLKSLNKIGCYTSYKRHEYSIFYRINKNTIPELERVTFAEMI